MCVPRALFIYSPSPAVGLSRERESGVVQINTICRRAARPVQPAAAGTVCQLLRKTRLLLIFIVLSFFHVMPISRGKISRHRRRRFSLSHFYEEKKIFC